MNNDVGIVAERFVGKKNPAEGKAITALKGNSVPKIDRCETRNVK